MEESSGDGTPRLVFTPSDKPEDGSGGSSSYSQADESDKSDKASASVYFSPNALEPKLKQRGVENAPSAGKMPAPSGVVTAQVVDSVVASPSGARPLAASQSGSVAQTSQLTPKPAARAQTLVRADAATAANSSSHSLAAAMRTLDIQDSRSTSGHYSPPVEGYESSSDDGDRRERSPAKDSATAMHEDQDSPRDRTPSPVAAENAPQQQLGAQPPTRVSGKAVVDTASHARAVADAAVRQKHLVDVYRMREEPSFALDVMPSHGCEMDGHPVPGCVRCLLASADQAMEAGKMEAMLMYTQAAAGVREMDLRKQASARISRVRTEVPVQDEPTRSVAFAASASSAMNVNELITSDEPSLAFLSAFDAPSVSSRSSSRYRREIQALVPRKIRDEKGAAVVPTVRATKPIAGVNAPRAEMPGGPLNVGCDPLQAAQLAYAYLAFVWSSRAARVTDKHASAPASAAAMESAPCVPFATYLDPQLAAFLMQEYGVNELDDIGLVYVFLAYLLLGCSPMSATKWLDIFSAHLKPVDVDPQNANVAAPAFRMLIAAFAERCADLNAVAKMAEVMHKEQQGPAASASSVPHEKVRPELQEYDYTQYVVNNLLGPTLRNAIAQRRKADPDWLRLSPAEHRGTVTDYRTAMHCIARAISELQAGRRYDASVVPAPSSSSALSSASTTSSSIASSASAAAQMKQAPTQPVIAAFEPAPQLQARQPSSRPRQRPQYQLDEAMYGLPVAPQSGDVECFACKQRLQEDPSFVVGPRHPLYARFNGQQRRCKTYEALTPDGKRAVDAQYAAMRERRAAREKSREHDQRKRPAPGSDVQQQPAQH